MLNITRTGFLALLIVSGVIAPASALETVMQKSTKKSFTGEVTKISVEGVTLESRAKTVEIPANDILWIKWTGEPPSLNVTRGDERGNRLDKALNGFQEAQKDIKSPEPGLKADLDFGVASTTAKMALAGSGEIDPALAMLETFRKEHPQSYHSYQSLDLLGLLHAQKQDWEQAGATYDLLDKSTIPEYKMAAKIGKAQLLLAQDAGDPAKAEAEFDAVIQMHAATPGEKSRQLDARFGKVTCQIQQQKFEEALAILHQILTDTTITENSVLARAYIQQGKCHVAAGKTQSAVMDFLHVDLLFAEDKPAHAEALYHLARLWADVGKPDRADDARTRLETLFPESRWVKQ